MLEWINPCFRIGVRMLPIRLRIRLWYDTVYEWWPDILGGLMLVIGLVVFLSDYFGWSIFYIPVLSELFLRIWPEMIGIGLAVIIIDNANEKLRTREQKNQLISQMGSPNNEFAIEAVRQLRVKGWMFDGSPRNMYFRGVNLENADLQQADLVNANLEVANLGKVTLSLANLRNARMEGAVLAYSFLIGTNLPEASLASAFLNEADMQGANLENASLNNSDLRNTDLRNANLRGADLRKAKLGERIFFWFSEPDPIIGSNADLTGSDLTNANLEGAFVSLDQLSNAKSLNGAIMPDGTLYKAESLEENNTGTE